jgi:hypothetical protein
MRSTEECEMSLVPERDVLEGGRDGGAHDAREAAEVLTQDRVPLVGHRARAFLACREALFGLAELAALPVAHVGGEPLDGSCEEAHRREQCRVSIA